MVSHYNSLHIPPFHYRTADMLLLLRAFKQHPGGPWSEDDLDVLDDEAHVRRILLNAASFTSGRDRPWFSGHAASLEDAMAAFKARWLGVSAGGQPRLP